MVVSQYFVDDSHMNDSSRGFYLAFHTIIKCSALCYTFLCRHVSSAIPFPVSFTQPHFLENCNKYAVTTSQTSAT